MPTVVQATVNQTPDPAFGSDSAVASPTNTGHAQTTIADTGAVDPAKANSCRWSGFADLPAKTKTTLKITVDLGGIGGASTDNGGGGTASASASMSFTYSIDGGSTFPNTITADTASCSGVCSDALTGGGSFSIDIPPSVPLNQIQIRERNTCTATASGGAPPAAGSSSVRTTVSGIQLEVEMASGALLVMM